ncbi:hypothetical protein [Pandoraea apista]|uniref:hypothetical protein n=1 Tax=Pandoraea apista TaxID=93218 RepID=UPI00058A8777|nr:hypothetical protein [Pandoraea apista]AJF00484.1 hypothetical protein SG18_24090 [Pandoraea apista]AKH74672.1 hypothetical protein XM39_24270 [Pandoraea apista]AKI63222.1 hypothetical protein AA956_17590 [Pandoraea apista]RRW91892.1 hypothetical protein EGJ54_20790 [Pandoraea apista]RRX01270.1 hypothetical protein EGJ56_16905 [Pandoraea apista]
MIVEHEGEFSIHGPYQAFYIQSMLFNTSSALQACQRASKYIEAISDGKIGPQDRKDELLDCLQNFINHSGAVARYFFPSFGGMKKEKKDIHQKRAAHLCRVFEVDEKSPLFDKQLRNAIEHFDERLDRYLEEGIVGQIFPSLILDKPEETEVPHHIFRAYYLNDGIYQVLGERHHVQPILDEMIRVHDMLVKFDENGGMLRIQSKN